MSSTQIRFLLLLDRVVVSSPPPKNAPMIPRSEDTICLHTPDAGVFVGADFDAGVAADAGFAAVAAVGGAHRRWFAAYADVAIAAAGNVVGGGGGLFRGGLVTEAAVKQAQQ